MSDKEPLKKSTNERGSSRIEELADELANLAEKTPSLYSVFKKVLLNEEAFYNILNDLVESQPEELVEAQKILARREDVIKNAHEEAQKVLDVAQKRLEELTSEQEVVRQAEREAERIIRDAEVRAEQIRVEAMEYVYQKMDELERQFGASLNIVKNSKLVLERELSQAVSEADVYDSEASE